MIDILLIEDNEELAMLISEFLKLDGNEIMAVSSGEAALEYLGNNQVKLILLDIMLFGMDGFSVCSEIRKMSNVPIMIMSARVDKEDKLNGFLLGADDYIEKPVDIDLLRVKIAALMKRNYDLKEKNTLIVSGELVIDKTLQQVFLKKNLLNLTLKEYELMLLLVQNPGKTLKKEYIFHQIWGVDSVSENQTLTVHIKMLRDKIEMNSKQPKRIITVWGVGYRYEEV